MHTAHENIGKRMTGVGETERTLILVYCGLYQGVLVWSRSPAAPLMYRKRNGEAGRASCMACRPTRGDFWQTRTTSAQGTADERVGVIATVLFGVCE